VVESEDVINAAVDGLINSGFINYYGLQVQETFFCLCFRLFVTVF
jgi:hypothetical protein